MKNYEQNENFYTEYTLKIAKECEKSSVSVDVNFYFAVI